MEKPNLAVRKRQKYIMAERHRLVYNCNDLNGSQSIFIADLYFSLKTLRAPSASEDEFLFTRFSSNIFAQRNKRKRVQPLLSSGLYNCRFHQVGYVLNLLNVEGI